jgi:hypothetical protein
MNPLSRKSLDAFQRADRVALHEALGLQPHILSPLDAGGIPPPDAGYVMWKLARTLRGRLEERCFCRARVTGLEWKRGADNERIHDGKDHNYAKG